MNMLKKLIAVAVMAAVAAPPQVFASGAVAGSTEYTQIASWAQNFQNFTSQITTLRNQLQTVRDTFDVAKQMREHLSSVTGLVRDVQSMANVVQEVKDLQNDVKGAFGALDSLKDLAESRFTEISRFKDQFGNRKSVQDYFIQSMRENAREHKMNQVLRDQEIGAIKRLEQSGKTIQEHARKISGTAGVHQSVALLNTQINSLAAMMADVNKITAVRAAKQTDQEDGQLAERKRLADKVREEHEILMRALGNERNILEQLPPR